MHMRRPELMTHQQFVKSVQILGAIACARIVSHEFWQSIQAPSVTRIEYYMH